MEYISNIGLFEDIDWVAVIGWMGAGITFLASSMRTIIVIRTVALISNVLFITYGLYASVYPVLTLHIALIVVNTLRLIQIRQDISKAKKHQNLSEWAGGLAPFMQKESLKAGDLLFAKGDAPDKIYIIEKGNIRLPEINKRLGAGELLGEIGFLTDAKQRTLSAICETDCQLLSANEDAFTKAYYQSPALGMSILKLVATRLNELATVRPSTT
jgi:hypothetical protein